MMPRLNVLLFMIFGTGIFDDFLGMDFMMLWLTGGVGGFLFYDVVLRTRFWINPPLRCCQR